MFEQLVLDFRVPTPDGYTITEEETQWVKHVLQTPWTCPVCAARFSGHTPLQCGPVPQDTGEPAMCSNLAILAQQFRWVTGPADPDAARIMNRVPDGWKADYENNRLVPPAGHPTTDEFREWANRSHPEVMLKNFYQKKYLDSRKENK